MADVFQLEDLNPGGDEACALDSDDDAIEIDDVSSLYYFSLFDFFYATIDFYNPRVFSFS